MRSPYTHTHQPTSRSTSQPTDPPTHTHQPINRPANQPTDPPITYPTTNPPNYQPTNRHANQPTPDQPTCQPTNRPLFCNFKSLLAISSSWSIRKRQPRRASAPTSVSKYGREFHLLKSQSRRPRWACVRPYYARPPHPANWMHGERRRAQARGQPRGRRGSAARRPCCWGLRGTSVGSSFRANKYGREFHLLKLRQ